MVREPMKFDEWYDARAVSFVKSKVYPTDSKSHVFCWEAYYIFELTRLVNDVDVAFPPPRSAVT